MMFKKGKSYKETYDSFVIQKIKQTKIFASMNRLLKNIKGNAVLESIT